MDFSGNIWITAGCFLIGMLIGGLVLVGTVKSARSQMQDLWDEEEVDEDESKENEDSFDEVK